MFVLQEFNDRRTLYVSVWDGRMWRSLRAVALDPGGGNWMPGPRPEEIQALAELLTGQSSDAAASLTPAGAQTLAETALTQLYTARDFYPPLTEQHGFHFAVDPGTGVLTVSVWDDQMWRTIGEVPFSCSQG